MSTTMSVNYSAADIKSNRTTSLLTKVTTTKPSTLSNIKIKKSNRSLFQSKSSHHHHVITFRFRRKLVKVIGQGSLGRVYYAIDTATSIPIVVK